MSTDDVTSPIQQFASPATGSVHTLFAKLRGALRPYDIANFAVYAFEGQDAELVFLSGRASSVASSRGPLQITSFPSLVRLLSEDSPYISRDAVGRPDDASTLGDDLPGVTATFRMTFESRPIGFILVFESASSEPLHNESLEELTSLVSLFSSSFAHQLGIDRLHRSYRRTQAKHCELQEAMEILLLSDRAQILDAMLRRALNATGSAAGSVWLYDADAWRPAHSVGKTPDDIDIDLSGLAVRCAESGAPRIVSSISGEEIAEFDADAILMASVTAFPLAIHQDTLGCLFTFDAAVSVDVVDMVEATVIAGAMAIRNWQSSQRMLEQRRLHEQLALVAKTQQRLLPTGTQDIVDLSVAHYSRYCEQAGGDYVDTIPSREPFFTSIVIGDVSGHGLSAALLMVDVRARLRTHLKNRVSWSPSEILVDLNTVLCSESGPQEFVTLLLGCLDTRTGLFSYSSAGHEPPLLFSARTGTWCELPSTGLPLGMKPSATYGVGTALAEPGDIIVLTTDGSNEAQNRNGEPFGTQAIRDVVAKTHESSAQDVLDSIVARIHQHCEGQPFVDDVTYLVLKVEKTRLRILDAIELPAETPDHHRRFPGTVEEKDRELRQVNELLATRFEGRVRDELLMAIEEAVTNAVLHGTNNRATANVELDIWLRDDGLTAAITQDGDAFDPVRAIRDQAEVGALYRECGRGIVIMTSTMDTVTFARDGKSSTSRPWCRCGCFRWRWPAAIRSF